MSYLSNGEELFFNKIKERCNIIFDVGCNRDSLFLDSTAETHYFDPVASFIEELKTKNSRNKKSFFNNFGLGESNKIIPYYTNTGSFVDRAIGSKETELYELRKGIEYIQMHKIEFIDFLKIDVELYELNVLEGFSDFLKEIKIIQFEYGPGTFTDLNIKLSQITNYLEKYGFNKCFRLSWDTGNLEAMPQGDDASFYNYIAFNERFLDFYKDLIV